MAFNDTMNIHFPKCGGAVVVASAMITSCFFFQPVATIGLCTEMALAMVDRWWKFGLSLRSCNWCIPALQADIPVDSIF